MVKSYNRVMVDWLIKTSQAGCGKMVEKVSCRVALRANEKLHRQRSVISTSSKEYSV